MPPFSNKTEEEEIKEFNKIEEKKRIFAEMRRKYVKGKPPLNINIDNIRDWYDDDYMKPDRPNLTPVNRHRRHSW